MTTVNEIRTELLEQHAQLRALIEETRTAAKLWRQGRGEREALKKALCELTEATHFHNSREEYLLGDIIPTVDAWGPVRANVMNDEHIHEHRELSAALLRATALIDAVSAASTVLFWLDQLLEHMEREEKVFLNEKILNDDIGCADAFGG